MRIKAIKDEDFVNYKKSCMFIGSISCTFKCLKELGLPCSICQNSPLSQSPDTKVDDEKLIQRYLNNPLTSAICFGGLEPLDQLPEIQAFIKKLRFDFANNDDVVIYSGYKEEEMPVLAFKKFVQDNKIQNIVLKVGRYVPNQPKRFDEILGVELASDNQYAIRLT